VAWADTSVPSGILIHPAVCLQQTWAEKWGCRAVPLYSGVGSPSNTMWTGLRPTSIPSGSPSNALWPEPRPTSILIHPTVWPQYTNVTEVDKTDRQWSDSKFYKRSPKNSHRIIDSMHKQQPKKKMSVVTKRLCTRLTFSHRWLWSAR